MQLSSIRQGHNTVGGLKSHGQNLFLNASFNRKDDKCLRYDRVFSTQRSHYITYTLHEHMWRVVIANTDHSGLSESFYYAFCTTKVAGSEVKQLFEKKRNNNQIGYEANVQ